jgi:hypothetical protein
MGVPRVVAAANRLCARVRSVACMQFVHEEYCVSHVQQALHHAPLNSAEWVLPAVDCGLAQPITQVSDGSE